MSLSFSQREFTALASKVRRVKKQTAKEFLHQHGRLFARDCLRGTPPFSGAPYTESFNTQRRTGEVATAADISRFFVLFSPQKVSRYLPGPVQEQDGFAGKLRKYARRGDAAALSRICKNLHFPCRGVLVDVDPELHRKERNYRGRIARKVLPWLILRINKRKQYVRREVGRVGAAKAGWLAPAQGLGLQVPAWISRHAGSPGLWLDQSGESLTPSVTIGNLVDWAQKFEDEFGVVEAAMENRRRSMQTSLDKILEHNRRKAGL